MKINAVNVISAQKTNKMFKQNLTATKNIQYKQINNISNVCYKPITFGRSVAEHKSWGAQIDPTTKEASFKILTYPDSKKVYVTVDKQNSQKTQTYELENKGNGIFETPNKIKPGEVEHGDKYFYTIEKGDGSINTVKDPYSFKQEKLVGSSTIYDHSQYNWNDEDWFSSNHNRISRVANSQNGLTPVNKARIYEFNTVTLTKKGTFEAAKAVIKPLPAMGFNAIEIMPVENTYSFNWGYDGVDKMAPSEHLGGPDGLKSLIDYAHEQGLNVIMDMVPNHLGPDGALLKKTGPFIAGENCFGEKFNFEGENSRYVRDYIVNCALNWLENYHCDGLRLDMTKFMDSDFTMKQIAAEVNYHYPDAFLIAEDGRSCVSVNEKGDFWDNWNEPHDKRVVNSLKPFESGIGQSEDVHCKAIEKIANSKANLGRIGFDSEWDFNYFHQLQNGLYGIINLNDFEKACYCAQDRVKYVMSHDEIGNYEGSRLIAKLLTPMLNLNENIRLNETDKLRAEELAKLKYMKEEDALKTVKLQKAQFVAEKLAILLQTGQIDKYESKNVSTKRWYNAVNQAFYDEILKPLDIKENSGINFDKLNLMYKRSTNKVKMAFARTYSIPGPKMVFQGDERADLTPFRFFRQFSSIKNEYYLYEEKGYKTNKEALEASTLGSLQYSPKGRADMNHFRALVRDLNLLNEENPALTSGVLIDKNTVKHQYSQVIGTHAKEKDNEIFSITNFGDADYPRKDAADYYIKFPKGEWIEVLNTDDKKYGGTGNYNNTTTIKSNGESNSPIKLARQSTKIFKRIN